MAVCANAQNPSTGSQRIVHGFVIDKNGNPIPGAEVMSTGGGESTVTDADGSFSLQVSRFIKTLTATYTGMQSRKLKVKPDQQELVFEMKPHNLRPWFLNIYGSVGIEPNERQSFGESGLMFGRLGKWGYYAKAGADFYGGADITIGAINRLGKTSSYIYWGAGYGMVDYADSYYYWDEYDIFPGMAVDLGFIFKTARHFNFTVGYTLKTDFEDSNHCIQVGLGYVF